MIIIVQLRFIFSQKVVDCGRIEAQERRCPRITSQYSRPDLSKISKRQTLSHELLGIMRAARMKAATAKAYCSKQWDDRNAIKTENPTYYDMAGRSFCNSVASNFVHSVILI